MSSKPYLTSLVQRLTAIDEVRSTKARIWTTLPLDYFKPVSFSSTVRNCFFFHSRVFSASWLFFLIFFEYEFYEKYRILRLEFEISNKTPKKTKKMKPHIEKSMRTFFEMTSEKPLWLIVFHQRRIGKLTFCGRAFLEIINGFLSVNRKWKKAQIIFPLDYQLTFLQNDIGFDSSISPWQLCNCWIFRKFYHLLWSCRPKTARNHQKLEMATIFSNFSETTGWVSNKQKLIMILPDFHFSLKQWVRFLCQRVNRQLFSYTVLKNDLFDSAPGVRFLKVVETFFFKIVIVFNDIRTHTSQSTGLVFPSKLFKRFLPSMPQSPTL